MSATADTIENDVQAYMVQLGSQARTAARLLAAASPAVKNRALLQMADAIEASASNLVAANSKDMDAGRKNGLSAALLDRLELTPARIEAMATGLRQVAGLSDPIGQISDMAYQDSGLQIGRMRVPLGVIGIIYESRPNVTADAAALCLKSGNAAILRGGSEAIHSNRAIATCIQDGLAAADLPVQAIQVVETTDRAAVGQMITMPEYVDVIIPRGGKGLIERVSQDARVPVIKHLDGICHVYIDEFADRDKAVRVSFNAKTQRYGTCNTLETLLVHQAVAADMLPELFEQYQQVGVELRGCKRTCELDASLIKATEDDWDTEYLAPVLSIRIVDNLDQAIDHIERHGSHHTDAIITENLHNSQRFLREVDSSSVMVNASTRFADGFEYGLGAEIGISTDKLHARGPVGLEGLTSLKYIVIGDGHTRS